jgi:hypothetical protein
MNKRKSWFDTAYDSGIVLKPSGVTPEVNRLPSIGFRQLGHGVIK